MVKLRSGTLKKTDATRIAGKVNQNFSLTKKILGRLMVHFFHCAVFKILLAYHKIQH